MNKQFIIKIKKDLLQQKSDILQNIKQTFEVDGSGDEIDAIVASQLTNVNNQLNHRERDKLVKISMALTKIDNNTFGLCIECEEDIGEKRLNANPCCVKCISCAEKSEFLSKRR